MPIFVRASSRARAYTRSGNASRGRERRALWGRMGKHKTELSLPAKRIKDAKIRLTEPGLSRARKRTIKYSIRSLRKHGTIGSRL